MQEQKDLLHDILAETIEDIALTNAIKAGETTETVSRDDVYKVLAG